MPPVKSTPAEENAVKKIVRKRVPPGVKTVVKLVDVRLIGVKKAAKVFKILYRDSPGFALVALPEEGVLIFRAEIETARDIEDLIHIITPLGSKSRNALSKEAPKKQ